MSTSGNLSNQPQMINKGMQLAKCETINCVLEYSSPSEEFASAGDLPVFWQPGNYQRTLVFPVPTTPLGSPLQLRHLQLHPNLTGTTVSARGGVHTPFSTIL